LLLDQPYLPVAPPFLQLLLAGDRAQGVIIDFEPDQLVDIVATLESVATVILTGITGIILSHELREVTTIQRITRRHVRLATWKREGEPLKSGTSEGT
jgi:hypothetical protein